MTLLVPNLPGVNIGSILHALLIPNLHLYQRVISTFIVTLMIVKKGKKHFDVKKKKKNSWNFPRKKNIQICFSRKKIYRILILK